MNFNFLSPVQDLVLAHNELLSTQVLGRKFRIHSKQKGIPDLQDVKIAIIGVLENRNDVNYIGEEINLNLDYEATFNSDYLNLEKKEKQLERVNRKMEKNHRETEKLYEKKFKDIQNTIEHNQKKLKIMQQVI